MQNEDVLTKLDTLQDIIHKMSSLPEDYDALHRAESYSEDAEDLIFSCRKYLLAVDACNRIRGYLLTSVITEKAVSFNAHEDIGRLMVHPEVLEQLLLSTRENAVWLRSVLTCDRPITPVFSEYADVIAAIIPELKPCIGFEHKSIYHKHNVYEHILAVVDGCKTNDFCVKMAALLHDIGKPHVCTTDETGHRHFHGHAAESVRLAKTVLSRLDVTEDETKLILDLIEHHDMQLAPTTNAVSRVKREHGADFIRKWAVLRQADRDDHVYKNKNTQFYTDIDGILATLDAIENEDKSFKITDLAINGDDLIQELGLKEGPIIGVILNKLCEEVKAGQLKNVRHELLNGSLYILTALKETTDEQRQPDATEEIDIDR